MCGEESPARIPHPSSFGNEQRVAHAVAEAQGNSQQGSTGDHVIVTGIVGRREREIGHCCGVAGDEPCTICVNARAGDLFVVGVDENMGQLCPRCSGIYGLVNIDVVLGRLGVRGMVKTYRETSVLLWKSSQR